MKRHWFLALFVVGAAMVFSTVTDAGWRRRHRQPCAPYYCQPCPQYYCHPRPQYWQPFWTIAPPNTKRLYTDKRPIREFSEDAEISLFDSRRKRFTEPDDDTFTVKKHHRGRPKTTYARAPVEMVSDLGALLMSLPDDDEMNVLTDKNQEWDFDRIPQEQHNVRVIAYLFAVAKESDNDFHLIVDDDGEIEEGAKMNVEISGVPTEGLDIATIRDVRDEFKALFNGNPPTKYKRDETFPFKPMRVEIEGSIFFDTDHPAGTVGPTGYRPASAWEIHPVRRIRLLD